MSARADRHQGITAARGREVHQSGIQPGRIESISVQIIEKQPNGPNGHVWLVVLSLQEFVFNNPGKQVGDRSALLLGPCFQLGHYFFCQRDAGTPQPK